MIIAEPAERAFDHEADEARTERLANPEGRDRPSPSDIEGGFGMGKCGSGLCYHAQHYMPCPRDPWGAR